MNPYTQSKSV